MDKDTTAPTALQAIALAVLHTDGPPNLRQAIDTHRRATISGYSGPRDIVQLPRACFRGADLLGTNVELEWPAGDG